MEKAIVVYSGGMDSYTLLMDMRRYYEIYAISFDYGQRHSKELIYADKVTEEINVPHKFVDMVDIGKELLSRSSQTSSDIPVPEGHYTNESMVQTVVPNRNMIMLSVAVGYAVNIGAAKVFFGAHAGDHAIYPDCRPDFIDTMNIVCKLANYQTVKIIPPYIYMTKGNIAVIGRQLGLDYSKTWTCYNGREKACGKCGACQERLEAMEYAGITDPLEYEDA